MSKYKVLFPVLAIAFAAAACNNAPQTSQTSPPPSAVNPTEVQSPSPTPAPVSPSSSSEKGSFTQNTSGYLYTNDFYGFKLQFPGSFEGIKVTMENDKTESTVKYFRFQVPRSKCDSSGECYMNPVTVGVYPNKVWQILSKEPPLNNASAKSNSSYTLSVSGWQEAPENTPVASQISKDIPKVQASLEVYNPKP
jgi:hypothetical protein